MGRTTFTLVNLRAWRQRVGEGVLGNARYRRFLAARTLSNVGNGMGPIALAFGVLALPDGSPTALSVVLAAQAVPLVLTLPIAGVMADRLGRARMIALTDIALSAVVATQGLLFITGQASIPVLAVLAALAGVLNGFWYPAFSGLVPDLVAEEHMQPANAYISLGSNIGMIAGSAIAGLIVSGWGAGTALLIDALTFLLNGLLVWTLRVPPRTGEQESVWQDFLHGWRVFTSYRWVVVIVGAFSVIVMVLEGAERVMGPVLAEERYGGAAGWAAVMATLSVGLLAGAFLGSRFTPRHPMVVGMITCLTLPAWLLTMALGAPLLVVCVTSLLWGVSIELFQVFWFTALHRNVPRDSLSRVASYDAMGSLMFGPLGLALAGPLISSAGPTVAFGLAAGLATLAILASLTAHSVRMLT
ncbi:MAG: MFS transporter [Actinomycetales bacterium]